MRLIVGLVCLAACLSLAAPVRSQEIRDGQALLTAMHDSYKDSWYDSVVFKEKAITLNPDGTTTTEIWDEALQLPGKLRINKGPSSEGNGFVFIDGTLTTFQKGKASGPRPYVHMLLVLGFDVYRQDFMSVMAFSLKTTESYQEYPFVAVPCIAVNRACPSRISWDLTGAPSDKHAAKQTKPTISLTFTSNLFRDENLMDSAGGTAIPGCDLPTITNEREGRWASAEAKLDFRFSMDCGPRTPVLRLGPGASTCFSFHRSQILTRPKLTYAIPAWRLQDSRCR